jgi:hypothetical protein
MIAELLRSHSMRNYHAKNNYHDNAGDGFPTGQDIRAAGRRRPAGRAYQPLNSDLKAALADGVSPVLLSFGISSVSVPPP